MATRRLKRTADGSVDLRTKAGKAIDALGIDDTDAILMIADMAHDEEELTVEFGE